MASLTLKYRTVEKWMANFGICAEIGLFLQNLAIYFFTVYGNFFQTYFCVKKSSWNWAWNFIFFKCLQKMSAIFSTCSGVCGSCDIGATYYPWIYQKLGELDSRENRAISKSKAAAFSHTTFICWKKECLFQLTALVNKLKNEPFLSVCFIIIIIIIIISAFFWLMYNHAL